MDGRTVLWWMGEWTDVTTIKKEQTYTLTITETHSHYNIDTYFNLPKIPLRTFEIWDPKKKLYLEIYPM